MVSEAVDTVAHIVKISDDNMENVDCFKVKDQSNVKGVKTLRELCELVIYQSVNGVGACGTEDTELLGTCGIGTMLANGGMFEALEVDQLLDLGRCWEVNQNCK